MKQLEFSLAALEDLEQTLEYIARDKPIAASDFVAMLEAKCHLLTQYPELGMRRDDLAPGLLVFAVSGYGIYYRILGEVIRIERVLRGSRDPGAIW